MSTSKNEYQNFNLNTSNYLGFQYEEYLTKLNAIAISKPSLYAEIRVEVLDILKQNILDEVYKTYYDLLTDAEKFDKLRKAVGGPCYPAQDASSFALGAARTINKILDEVLKIVLPSDQAQFASLQTSMKAAAASIDAGV